MDIPDRELVEKSVEGDQGAYEALVRRYDKSVYNLAYRMTNSPADAQDLTQETFLRAYRNLEKYDDRYSFRNWILTICSNITKNVFRKRVKQRETEERYLEEKYHKGASRDPGREMFEQALTRLSTETRTALTLKYTEGCSYDEIAEILSIGVSAAKMRVMRGREELKKILNKPSG